MRQLLVCCNDGGFMSTERSENIAILFSSPFIWTLRKKHNDFNLSSFIMFLSRFMGFPVPSSPCLVCVRVRMCEQVSVGVCVIEADSLQLRVITVGLYLFLSRSHRCQILAVFAVVVYGPFWFRDS